MSIGTFFAVNTVKAAGMTARGVVHVGHGLVNETSTAWDAAVTQAAIERDKTIALHNRLKSEAQQNKQRLAAMKLAAQQQQLAAQQQQLAAMATTTT